jgi:hypothetical protein
MTRLMHSGPEKILCWMAELAGFGQLDDGVTRRALWRLMVLGAGAWGLAGLATATAMVSPLAGIALLSLVAAVLAGGILIMSQTNFELATLLASSAVAPPPEREAPAAVMPPPIPVAPQRVIMRATRPATSQLISRGTMEGRAYSVFSDGSIELETAFGPRWFASVELAHEFIGLRNGALLRLTEPQLAQVA